MRKVLSIGLAVAASATLLIQASPADAAVKWDGSVVEVINKLPSDWPVSAALNWVDTYTGSDLRIVKSCGKNVRRCITIKQGRLTGAYKNVTGRSHDGARADLGTITIDVWKTKNVKPFKGRFGYYTKRYLIAHELLHQRYTGHVKSCNNVMHENFRCNGHVPPLKLTTAQKKKLAGY